MAKKKSKDRRLSHNELVGMSECMADDFGYTTFNDLRQAVADGALHGTPYVEEVKNLSFLLGWKSLEDK